MTAIETFANQPLTTVVSGGTTASASGTTESWTVASSASFPGANSGGTPPTQFHVADTTTGKTGEIIAVTSVSGTTWTVTRGAESTTPVAHPPGFPVVQVVSAGALGGLLQSGNNLSDVDSAATSRSNLGILTNFAPTGLTGATATSRYAGATTSGAPVTGTFAVRDYVVDGTGKIWICTTAGSPGTWAQTGGALDTAGTDIQPLGVQGAGNVGLGSDAGHVHPWQPFQFLVKSYGAKGDGIMLTDAVMTASSAVLTSAGLSAPSAPSVAHSGSGGTIAAGTYQVKVTLVNHEGETMASSSASVTTTGSASTITISSPALGGNAYFWYAYVTQAGGSTYTRQQAAGSPTVLGTNLVLTAPPSSSGPNPPGANTTAHVFSAADVGKHVMVNNAGSAPASDTSGALFTTISSWSSGSPSSVTLATPAARTVSSMTAMFGTDDSAAIKTAMNALMTCTGFWGQPYYAELLFDPGVYVLATMPHPGGDLPAGMTYGNAQIPLPVVDLTGTKTKSTIVIRSTASDNSTLDYWEQSTPQIQGTCLFSMVEITNANAVDPTYGPVSVIGGPQVTAPFTNNFDNVLVVIDAIQVVCPVNPGQIALDFANMLQFAIKTASIDVFASVTGSPAINFTGSGPTNTNGLALRVPVTGLNDRCDIDSLTIEGYYYGMTADEHVAARRVAIIYTNTGIYVNGHGANQASHGCWFGYASVEICTYCVYAPGGFGGSLFGLYIDCLDNEGNVTYHISDASNYLGGRVNVLPSQSQALPVPVLVNGAANLEILTGASRSPQRGAVTAPSVPASTTALQNPFWRHAWVAVTGGTVSSIAVDGVPTGQTLAGGQVATTRVPSGKTITLTYTSAPAWNWWLD